MDEVLRPDEDVLSALAAQMGLHHNEPVKAPATAADKKPPMPPAQKSYSQLT